MFIHYIWAPPCLDQKRRLRGGIAKKIILSKVPLGIICSGKIVKKGRLDLKTPKNANSVFFLANF